MKSCLSIKTDYSILTSLIKIPDLISYAINNHIEALGIIDDNLSSSMEFILECQKNNIKYVLSKNSLNDTYPKDIILNALITKEYFVHNTKYTDENLLKNVQYKKIVNV